MTLRWIMADSENFFEEIRGENGKILAVRAGGGHRNSLNEETILSLVKNQSTPPIIARNNMAAGSSNTAVGSSDVVENSSKILVIRDMGLGDILMTLPVLLKLKHKYPQAEIHFATKPQYISLAEPFCDKVMDYRQVQPEVYDSIYNLVMYCELHRDAAVKPRSDIFMEGVGVENQKYSVEELDFSNKYLSEKDREEIRNKFHSFGVSLDKPIVALCTDSNRGAKNWAPQKFEELVKKLSIEHPEYNFVFFGSASKEFTTSENVFNMCEKLSLKEFIAALDLCKLVITLETGAMHVAGVLGKPFVVICGPSDYRLFTKYYDNYSVIHPDISCYPCNGECDTNRCIRIIGMEFVYNVIKERIDRIEQDFTAIYPTSRDLVNIEVRRTANIKRIGIISVWAEQGLGYMTQNFRNALKDNFEVFVYGTFPMYAPSHAPIEGEWNIPNLFLSDKTRENMDVREVVQWAEDNHIEAVVVMEPTGDKIWQIVLELKGSGIYTIGIPMIEIAKSDEVFNHAFLDKTISLTKQCHRVLIKHGVKNSVYIPYGIPRGEVGFYSYLKNKPQTVFYFNAGWADERKNAEAVLNAFDLASQERDDILLFFHSQAEIERFPLHQQKMISENSQILFSTGSLSHREIMEITNSVDVIIIPTKREGVGILFLEALSFGKPIIAADNPPMNEYVRNNINGYLCVGKKEPIVNNQNALVEQINIDYQDLSKNILKVLDGNKIEDFSENSKKIYDREYSFEIFSQNLEAVFSDEIKEKKIFFIGNYLYPKIGGAEAAVFAYLSYLADHGYDVYALCDKGGINAAVHRVGDFFATTQLVVHNNIKIIQSAENVEKCAEHYILKIKPDLILTQLSMAGEIMKVAKQLNVPTAMYIHSVAEHFCSYHVWDCQGGKQDLETCDFKSAFCMKEYVRYKEHQFDYADYILANSDFTQRLTKRFYDRDSYVLYPPVQNIQRIEEPFNNRYILLVNPVIDKGIDIFCAIADRMPEYIFLIVGINDEAIRARIVNEQSPNGRIATVPYTDDVNQIYKQCRLVCMPSVVQEGFGMVAAEAMYAGIPVITSGRGGLSDVAGDAGIIIEDYMNVDKWITEIKKLLEDKIYYDEIRTKCITQSEKFLVENQGELLLSLLDNILNRGVEQ